MLKSSRICAVSVNLHVNPSVEIKGKLSLMDPRSRLYQFQISKAFHCDGLLLCTNQYATRVVVWTPCTGQTRWIQPSKKGGTYALGSYQDKKSGNNNSYKILCYWGHREKNQKNEIYELNSNSWRVLEATPNCSLVPGKFGVSLKGKTYWFAFDEKEEKPGVFLVSFDYTTERFGRLHLPFQGVGYVALSLSVVREEKLWVLLHYQNRPRTEIWVTSKIGDETKEIILWSMDLAVDFDLWLYTLEGLSIFFDDEKKAIVCCDVYKFMANNESYDRKILVYIFGQDNKVRQVDYGIDPTCRFLFNYAPSLIHIQQGVVGGKRKMNS